MLEITNLYRWLATLHLAMMQMVLYRTR